nr:hypothetical protein [Mucilaginibacter sp. FT3.2]
MNSVDTPGKLSNPAIKQERKSPGVNFLPVIISALSLMIN